MPQGSSACADTVTTPDSSARDRLVANTPRAEKLRARLVFIVAMAPCRCIGCWRYGSVIGTKMAKAARCTTIKHWWSLLRLCRGKFGFVRPGLEISSQIKALIGSRSPAEYSVGSPVQPHMLRPIPRNFGRTYFARSRKLAMETVADRCDHGPDQLPGGGDRRPGDMYRGCSR